MIHLELQLEMIGFCLTGLGLVHAIFPRQFNWKQELSSLSIINRDMMYVHTFFIAFMLLLVGFLCLTSAGELVGTTLGRRVSLGLGLFWIARWLAQFWGYSSKNWKGKQMETVIHIGFAVFWFYLSVVFVSVYFS